MKVRRQVILRDDNRTAELFIGDAKENEVFELTPKQLLALASQALEIYRRLHG